MQRPDKINILGTDIKIKFFGDEEQREMDGRFGYWCSASQTMGIYDKLPPTTMADSLLHEILHAIFWFLNMNKQIDNSKSTYELQECIVSQMSSTLQSTLRSNPDVLSWYLSLI